jgi:hypothetical protein
MMSGSVVLAFSHRERAEGIKLTRLSGWTFGPGHDGLPGDRYRIADDGAVWDGAGGSPIGRLHDRMPAGFSR